jgi:hypothetical protein
MLNRFAMLATLSALAWLLTAGPAQAAEQQYDCNQVLAATAPNVALLAGLLGVFLQDNGQVGISCRQAGTGSPGKPYCGGTSFGDVIITGGRAGKCPAAATTRARATRKATAKRRAVRA